MPRRTSSRRRESNLEKAVMGLVLMPVVFWFLVPTLRPVMVIAGIILLLGVVVILIYRQTCRQTQDEADFLRKLSGSAPTPIEAAPSKPRYVTRKSLLSKAEAAFHKVLLEAVPEAPIFPKVRVADVMDAAERYSGDFLRISQKHFDWVLCHPVSFEPLIAIELDDSSHQWSHKQQKNDQVKDDAAREAGIHLLRFPWQRSYDQAQIRERIADVLDKIADAKESKSSSA